MSKKVLVTGAAGFIGSFLCDSLIEMGYDIKAFIRYNSRNFWGWLENSPYKDKMEIFSGDIRNYDSVKYAMKGVDMVFHLAALIGIPYSYYSSDSYVDTNIKGTLNILEAARDEGIKKIVHTSTSEVYGTARFVPITEEHPVNPQSPYAATKAGADFIAMSFYRSFDLPVATVRPFNTYGPRQSARAVIPTIITQILNGKRIKLGTTSSTRDLTYVKDTVQGFIKAGESENAIGEVINLGNNSDISVKDLAILISRLMDTEIEIDIDPSRVRPERSEVEKLRADTEKARKILGWAPNYSLEQGLKETIEWFMPNKDIYKSEIYNV